MFIECAVDARRECRDVSADHALIWSLRLVLVTALDRETAARCTGIDPESALSLYPSSLYTLLAVAATRSPFVWQRCAGLVDRSLGDTAGQFDRATPAALLQIVAEGRELLTGRELAGLLWSLIRRWEPDVEPALGPVIIRLSAELEVAARRFASPRAASGEAAFASQLPLASGFHRTV